MTEPNPDNPTAEFALSFDEEEVKVVVEFHFSDNAEEWLDVPGFVNFASTAILKAMS